MTLVASLKAATLMVSNTKSFHPEEVFRGKKVAIIGAANTALEERNGDFIDSFDLVIRVNKALHTWNPENEAFIGKRTDVLYHSFFENEYSGGGPIDLDFFRRFGLQYLVHPHCSARGLLAHLNFYKRHKKREETFLLARRNYCSLKKRMGNWMPTIGFAALYSVLNAPCKEVYITGFTFFKTPYSPGYRDHFLDPKANEMHIKKQNLHDPDLEFKLFLELLENNNCEKVFCDKALSAIIQSNY